MKRYLFRLEAVLKVRTMHEETCRNELGRLSVERQRMLDQIATLNHEIQLTYESQEKNLTGGMRASQAAFFPLQVEGKNAHIQSLKAKIQALDTEIEAKRREHQQKRAELKVVQNLKENDLLKWKKAFTKETDQKVEEMVQLWDLKRKPQEDEV
jgi:flagellar export protein FliJ